MIFLSDGTETDRPIRFPTKSSQNFCWILNRTRPYVLKISNFLSKCHCILPRCIFSRSIPGPKLKIKKWRCCFRTHRCWRSNVRKRVRIFLPLKQGVDIYNRGCLTTNKNYSKTRTQITRLIKALGTKPAHTTTNVAKHSLLLTLQHTL